MTKVLIQNLSTRAFISGDVIVKYSNLPISVDEVVANKLAKLYPAEIKIIDTAKGGAKSVSTKAKSSSISEEDKSFEEGAK